jgi:type IV pilus assembly protein PilB
MSPADRQLLGIAIEAGLIGEEIAAQVQRRLARGGDAAALISLLGRVPRSALARAAAAAAGMPYIDGPELEAEADPALARALGDRLLRDAPWVALAGGRVAVADPRDADRTGSWARLLGRPLAPVLAEAGALAEAHRRLAVGFGLAAPLALDAVREVDELIAEAWCHRATDLHLEAEEGGHRVRLRIDGRMHLLRRLVPPAQALPWIGRIKVLAGLDVSETRAPQDGGLRHRIEAAQGIQIDLRVATLPTRHGERVTVRLLGVGAEGLDLDRLDPAPACRRHLLRALAGDHGLVLVAGATGSGKSTTLYAALRHLDTRSWNVLTVEDPVEYALPGISQVQVDQGGRLGFATALRSFLRHDPDVIMVGEVRDADTLAMCLRAAMTGHLVLSTLHTASAAAAIARLADMGAERYLIADTVRLVLAQRLLRRLCQRCRRRADAAPPWWDAAGDPPWEAVGCPACRGTGYSGRVAAIECLPVTEAVRQAIIAGRTGAEIEAAAGGELWPLERELRRRCAQGLTDAAEVAAALPAPAGGER